MNNVGAGSIPFEWALSFNEDAFRVTVISYFDSTKNLNDDSVPNHDIDIISLGVRSPFDPRGIRDLYKAIRVVQPDILHVHHNLSGSFGRIVGRFLNVPAIVDTEHNDHRGFRLLGNLLNGSTLGLSDVIVCNSRNTKDSFYWWEDRLVRKDKKTVIHNGVDLDKVINKVSQKDQIKREFGLEPRDYIIGNVGMLIKQKDQKSLVLAMEKILESIPQTKLVIVGNGKLKQKLASLAKSLGIEDKIVFTGLLEREKVYRLLHSFDIFAMVSLWEGFCNAVVEAMAAGLPVIATDVEPLPEVVGNAGAYIPPNDPQKLAEVIIDLYNNPEKAKEMAKKGQQRAQNKFSLEKTIESYEKLYLDLYEKKMG